MQQVTHEQFVAAIHGAIIAHTSRDCRDKLLPVKLTYGVADNGVRGVTYFKGWNCKTNGSVPLIGVNALCEESKAQIAGNVVHEDGHVIAGSLAGHSKEWKEATRALGLRNPLAGGQKYMLASFDPWLRDIIASMEFSDGAPQCFSSMGLGGDLATMLGLGGKPMRVRPCGAGIGTRGGKSRGIGSGSRLRKYVCGCDPVVIIRASTDSLACTCDHCSTSFKRA